MKSLIAFIIISLMTAIAIPAPIDNRQKIVVIDTGLAKRQLNDVGICLNQPQDDVTDYDLGKTGKRSFRHGENVTGLILDRIDKLKYCVYVIKAFGVHETNYIDALKRANDLSNVAAINLSIDSEGKTPDGFEARELFQIRKAMAKNIRIHVAAGNHKLKLTKVKCWAYPVCLYFKVSDQSNFKVIASTGKFSNSSVDIPMITYKTKYRGFPKMRGTSQTTAVYTGRYYSK